MPTTENELSEREQEILRLVATGASNKEIALQLSISANTVKVHLHNIFAKIGASSRTEAAMFAVNAGWVEKSRAVFEPETDSQLAVLENQILSAARRWGWIGIPILLMLVVITGYLLFRSNPSQENIREDEPAQWKQLASMPTARHNLAVVAYDGYIYAISGQSVSGLTGAVERYDLQNDIWVKVADKPTPVYEAEAAVIGGKVYIPGGRLANGGVTEVLEIYDPGQDLWLQGSQLPQAVSAYALVSFEGRLYLFGGWDGSRYLSSVYIYDPMNDVWMEGYPMPTPRAYHSAAVSGRKVYVIGGKNDHGELKANEVYFPDLGQAQKDSWKTEKPLPLESPSWKAVSLADFVYACGEIQVNASPSYGVFYISQDGEWQLISNQPGAPAKQAGLVGFGTNIYTIGGLRSGKPAGDAWTQQVIFLITIPMISK